MFICPPVYPFGDQFFWGELAYKQGVGIKPVPLSRLTEKKFLKAIKQLVADENIHRNSKILATKINKENGVEKAVKMIEELLKTHTVKRSA